MRILIITNLYPNPLQPNRASFNRQQFQALAAEHHVAVIAPIAWADELRSPWRSRRALLRDRQLVRDGLTVYHPRYYYTPKVLRRWYGQFFRESIRSTFQRACAVHRPEIVLGSWAYPDGWAAVELGHRAGLPVVIKVHGSDILWQQDHPERHQGTVDALRRADGVVAVSQDLEARVLALGVRPERIRVIYNGVDAGLFHPGCAAGARARLGLPAGKLILLSIGNLVPVKGFDVLLEALAQLVRAEVEFTCYLVGQGPARAQLEQQVHRSGLAGRVVLVGPRPHPELPDWYRAADLFVLPSRSEGVPNVLLEAMACGVRVVATRVGGVPEIAHFGKSRLVAPGDPAVLAYAIQEQLQSPVELDSPFPSPGRSYAESAREMADFLAQIAKASTRRSVSRRCPLKRGGQDPVRA
jgi:glycosyltransferase involved in cell wall biosynthesis